MDISQPQVQLTSKYWPNSSQLRQKLSIPLALSFSPSAQQANSASFNEKNLQQYRCQSCKAFINKYCLIRNQSSYDCSLCGFSNHVNQNIDKTSAQLNFSSYKCRASKIQRVIMSKERVFVFILDFSNYSQTSQKYLLYSIHAIREFANHSLRQKKPIKVMLLGFDDGIQIFHLKSEIQRVLYWDDTNQKNSTINDYPFLSYEQICLLSECKDNFFAVLDVLEQEVNQRKFRSETTSKKIMEVVQYALKHTKIQSGKIFVVSGLNHELQKFKVMKNYDSTVQDSHKHHFPVVKKQCLTESLQNLLNSTQMSVSFFFHKFMYANLIPFHIITKSTNGQLRQYLKHQTDHFFYQFNYLLHQCLYEMKFQTLLRVRSGIGLKLVGIFGNYRPWKGINDQIQMLSCQNSRKYVFQFIIEGKINSPTSIVQFAVLYTDLKGNRFYRIITQQIKLTSEVQQILPEINYQNVNFIYLKAILHNMELTPNFRKLQLALQQRCKKHVKILRQVSAQKNQNQAFNHQNLMEEQYMKNAKIYAIFAFMLMKHFLLNMTERRDIYMDMNIEIRSKLSCLEDCLKIIWPILYVVNQNGAEIVQMKTENFALGTVGIVINRGDQIFIYIKDQGLRNTIRIAKDLKSAIQQCAELKHISDLLQQIQDKKAFPHLDILIIEPNFTVSFDIFSRKGNHSFSAFIETLLQN